MITGDAECKRGIKSRIAIAKTAFNKEKDFFNSKLELNFRNELVKCYIWSVSVYGVETCTLRKVDKKYLKNFEIRRRMEKLVEPIV
jgi:hypothetical protein